MSSNLDEDNVFDPAVAAAIERMTLDGRDPADVGHALISGGLYHLAANLNAAELLEQLNEVRQWIVQRIADTRSERN